MTKVLIISNKLDVTTDFIIKELKQRNIDFFRFNTEELTKSCFISLDLTKDSFTIHDAITNKINDLREFSSVYFRRPELPTINNLNLTIGEETFLKNEIAFTLEGVYKIIRNAYWVSPLFSIREAENKIYQLDVAKSIGFVVPESIVTNNYDEFINFYDRNDRNCIIKPIKSGLIKDETGSKVIFTNKISDISISKADFEISPNFIQKRINKKGDIRVTIVGNKIFATFIHSQNEDQTKTDWRRGETELKHTRIDLPSSIIDNCNKLMSELNLRFGAIDLTMDEEGQFTFLEINPNGQWAWIERQTGYKISTEIVNLLEYENF